MAAHALCRRESGLVDMHPLHGAAGGRRGGTPDGVVEDYHFVGAGDALQQQGGDFGVVEGSDGVGGSEVGAVLSGRFFGGRGKTMDDLEGVVVEVEGRFTAADVVDGCGNGLVGEVTLWNSGSGVDVVEGDGTVGWWDVKVKGSDDVAAGDAVLGGEGGGGSGSGSGSHCDGRFWGWFGFEGVF